MLADEGLLNDNDLTARAVLIYATYLAVNLFRHRGRATSQEVAADSGPFAGDDTFPRLTLA